MFDFFVPEAGLSFINDDKRVCFRLISHMIVMTPTLFDTLAKEELDKSDAI